MERFQLAREAEQDRHAAERLAALDEHLATLKKECEVGVTGGPLCLKDAWE